MKSGLSLDWMPGWPAYEMTALLDMVRQAGFEVVELGINFEYFGWHTSKGVARLQRILSELGLVVHSLHSPIDELLGTTWDLSAKGPSRETALDMCRRGIDALSALSGGVLIVHPAAVRIPDGEQGERFARAAESLHALLNYARGTGVTVTLENLFGTKTPLFWRIVSEMEGTGLRYCFDTGHAILEKSEGTPLEKFERLRPEIVSLHLQDNHGQTDEHLIPGEGIFPWTEFLPRLRASYTGPLLLECNPRRDEPDLAAWLQRTSQAAEWLAASAYL